MRMDKENSRFSVRTDDCKIIVCVGVSLEETKKESSLSIMERQLMGGKEKKEESWLHQLCGDDAKLYDILSSTLYLDPIAGMPKEDLGTLIEAAEKSVKDEDYEEAIRLYRSVVDKAIFEATQHQEEKDRYIRIIQDLVSKTAQATEKLKDKLEKEGVTDRVAALERGAEYSKFLSERIEDVLEIANHFYGERLNTLGEQEREDGRLEEKSERRRKERAEAEKEEKRDKKGEKERKEKRAEEDREEEREKQKEKETGEARRKKILETRK
jgi:hypothetical protein